MPLIRPTSWWARAGASRRLACAGAATAVALAAACSSDEDPSGSGSGAGASGSSPELSITIDREIAAAYYGEGDVMQHAWERAHEILERVAAHEDATPQDLVNLACAKLKLWQKEPSKQEEETPRIQELCERALARDPRLASAHYVLGLVAYDRSFDLDTAIEKFDTVLELVPDDIPVRMRLAEVLGEAGERDEAIELFESVRALGSDFAGGYYMPAIYKLARLLRMRRGEGDLDRSAELLEEHKKRSEAGQGTASDDELKLGNLARVIVPRPGGVTRPPPASAPAVRFDALPSFLVEECVTVSSLEVADLNSDARADVLAAGIHEDGKAGVWALMQQESGAFTVSEISRGSYTRALPIDFENEFGMGVLLLGEGGFALQSPDRDADGGFVDGTPQLPKLTGSVSDWQPVDFGHDGNVDLALATSEGLKLVRNDGCPVDQYTKERTGPLRLVDVTAESGLPADPIAWVAIEDVDGDQDVDLIVGGPGAATRVLSNLRKGRFETLEPEKTGLPAELAQEPLFSDLDHDGRPDALLPGDPPSFAKNRGDGTFAAGQPLPDLAALWTGGAALADLDLDGELDFVGTGADGQVMARFGSLLHAGGATLVLGGKPLAGAAPLLCELDDDADVDLVTLGEPGVSVRCGSAPAAHSSLLLHLKGNKDNRQGIGAVVEVRAQERYERRFATARQQIFGLGSNKSADLVRITWPNGVVQHLIRPESSSILEKLRRCGGAPHSETASARPVTVVSVPQKEGLAGSCPFLYSWDGERYVFVSDVLGITPLGLPMSDDAYVPPDHDELVRVTSAQLAAVDGEYRFQVTEELREVTYLDRAQLWVVDHEAGVEVHPEERFCFPPFPPQRLHTVRGALPPVLVTDQDGRDWTGILAEIDERHAVPFEPMDSRYLGLATSHHLDVTLPDAVKSAPRIRLLMTGWLYWTDASVNVLAARNGSIRFVPPVISVPDGAGGWRETGPPVGFPAGKTKTMVLDVTSLVNRDDPRLRIASTLRLYWDAIEIAVDAGDAPITVTKLEPIRADLWHRGFSAPIADARADQPERFDWDVLEPFPRWNQHPGMLTRTGDVRPLLGEIDDRFAIFSAGDAVDLRFDATAVVPVAPGMERTYLVFFDGWAKDADPNTLFSQTVEPLPFHGMSGYPYRADEGYPDDDFHVDYRLEWNTRPARKLIPSLAPSITPEAPDRP